MVAVPLLLRVLLADRSRGRRRCPRCWYGMDGVPAAPNMAGVMAFMCPECRRATRRERDLMRTRPRVAWRWAVLIGVVVGYGLWCMPRVVKEGWRGIVPTTGLAVTVAGPQGGRDLFWIEARSFAAERLDKGWGWQQGLAVAKARLEQRARGRLLTDSTPAGALAMDSYDLRPITGGWRDFRIGVSHCGLFPPPPDEFVAAFPSEERDKVMDLLSMLVDPELWVVNGGDQVSVARFGPRVLVMAPARTHAGIADLLRMLSEDVGEGGVVRCAAYDSAVGPDAARLIIVHDLRDFVLESWIPEGEARITPVQSEWELLRDVYEIIQTNVAPEGWVDNGGDESRMCVYRHRLIVQASRNVHDQVAKLLETLREGREHTGGVHLTGSWRGHDLPRSVKHD